MVFAPAARAKRLSPVDPFAVVTVKLESVVVSARLKAMLSLSLVVIVFPPLYAFCKLNDAFAHWIRSFAPSIQSGVPVFVDKPLNATLAVLVVLNVTALELFGEKTDAPSAVNA